MADKAEVIGIVEKISGTVIITAEDGSTRIAQEGDFILATDELDTTNGSVELAIPPAPVFIHNEDLTVIKSQIAANAKPEKPLDNSNNTTRDSSTDNQEKTEEQLIKDLTENLAPTAAGQPLSQGGTTFISTRSGTKVIGKIGGEVLGADGNAVGTDALGAINLSLEDHAILQTLRSGGLGTFTNERAAEDNSIYSLLRQERIALDRSDTDDFIVSSDATDDFVFTQAIPFNTGPNNITINPIDVTPDDAQPNDSPANNGVREFVANVDAQSNDSFQSLIDNQFAIEIDATSAISVAKNNPEGYLTLTVPEGVQIFLAPGVGLVDSNQYSIDYPKGSVLPLLNDIDKFTARAETLQLAVAEVNLDDFAAAHSSLQDIVSTSLARSENRILVLEGATAEEVISGDRELFVGELAIAEEKLSIIETIDIETLNEALARIANTNPVGQDLNSIIESLSLETFDGARPPNTVSDLNTYLDASKEANALYEILADIGAITYESRTTDNGLTVDVITGIADSVTSSDLDDNRAQLIAEYDNAISDIESAITQENIYQDIVSDISSRLDSAESLDDLNSIVTDIDNIESSYRAAAENTVLAELIGEYLSSTQEQTDAIIELVNKDRENGLNVQDTVISHLETSFGDLPNDLVIAVNQLNKLTYEIDSATLADTTAKANADLAKVQQEIPELERLISTPEFVAIQNAIYQPEPPLAAIEQQLIDLRNSIETQINTVLVGEDNAYIRAINIEFFRDINELLEVFNSQSSDAILANELADKFDILIDGVLSSIDGLQSIESALTKALEDNSFILYSNNSQDFSYSLNVTDADGNDANLLDDAGNVILDFPQSGNILVDVFADGIEVDASGKPVDGVVSVTVNHILAETETGSVDLNDDRVAIDLVLDIEPLDPSEEFATTINLPTSLNIVLENILNNDAQADLHQLTESVLQGPDAANWSITTLNNTDGSIANFQLVRNTIPLDENRSELNLQEEVSLVVPRTGPYGFNQNVSETIAIDFAIDATDIDLDLAIDGSQQEDTVRALDYTSNTDSLADAILVKSLQEGESTNKSTQDLLNSRNLATIDVTDTLTVLAQRVEFLREVFLSTEPPQESEYNSAITSLFRNSEIKLAVDIPDGQSLNLSTLTNNTDFTETETGYYSLSGESLNNFFQNANYRVLEDGSIDFAGNTSIAIGPGNEHSSTDFFITTSYVVENYNNNQEQFIGKPDTRVVVDAIAEGVSFTSTESTIDELNTSITLTTQSASEVDVNIALDFSLIEASTDSLNSLDYTISYDLTTLANELGEDITLDMLDLSWGDNQSLQDNTSFYIDSSIPGRTLLQVKLTDLQNLPDDNTDNSFTENLSLSLTGDLASLVNNNTDLLSQDINVTAKEIDYAFNAGTVQNSTDDLAVTGGTSGISFELNLSFTPLDDTGSESFTVLVDVTELANLLGFDPSDMLGLRFTDPAYDGIIFSPVTQVVDGETRVFMTATIPSVTTEVDTNIEFAINNAGLEVLRDNNFDNFETKIALSSTEVLPTGDADFNHNDNTWTGTDELFTSRPIAIDDLPINTHFSEERQHSPNELTANLNEGFVFNLAELIGEITPSADSKEPLVKLNGTLVDSTNGEQIDSTTEANPIEAKLQELLSAINAGEEFNPADYEDLSITINVAKEPDSNLSSLDFSVNNGFEYFNTDNSQSSEFVDNQAELTLSGRDLYNYLLDPTTVTILTPEHEAGGYTINGVNINYTEDGVSYTSQPFISPLNVEVVAESSGVSSDGINVSNLSLFDTGGDRSTLSLDIDALFADQDNSELQTIFIELPDNIDGASSRGGLSWQIENQDIIEAKTGATLELKNIDGKDFIVFSDIKNGSLDTTINLSFDSDILAKVDPGEFTPEFTITATTAEKVFQREDGSNDSLKSVFRETTSLDYPGFEPSINISEIQTDFSEGFTLDLQEYVDKFGGSFRDEANISFGIEGNTNIRYIGPDGEELRVDSNTGLVTLSDEQLRLFEEADNGFQVRVIPTEFTGDDLEVSVRAARGPDVISDGEGVESVGPSGFRLDISEFIATLGDTATSSSSITLVLSGGQGLENTQIFDINGNPLIGSIDPTTGNVSYTLDSALLNDYVNSSSSSQSIIIHPAKFDSEDFTIQVNGTDNQGSAVTLYEEMTVNVDAVASGIDETRASTATAGFNFTSQQVENPYDRAELAVQADEAQALADTARELYERNLDTFGPQSPTVIELRAEWESLQVVADGAAERALGGSSRTVDVLGDASIDVELDIQLADNFDSSEDKRVIVDISEFIATVPLSYQDDILNSLTINSFGATEDIGIEGGRWNFELNTQGTPETNPDFGKRTGRIILEVEDDFTGDSITGTLSINGIDPYQAFANINNEQPDFNVKVAVESEEKSYNIDVGDDTSDNVKITAETVINDAYREGSGPIYDALVSANDARVAYEEGVAADGENSSNASLLYDEWQQLNKVASELVAKAANPDFVSGNLEISPNVIQVKENQGELTGGADAGIFSIDINQQLLHIQEEIETFNGLSDQAKFEDASLDFVIGGAPNFQFLDQYGIDISNYELQEVRDNNTVVGYRVEISGSDLQTIYNIWSSEIAANISIDPTFDPNNHSFTLDARTNPGDDLDYSIRVDAYRNSADIEGFTGTNNLVLVSPEASTIDISNIQVESEIRYVSGEVTGGTETTLTDEVVLNIQLSNLGIADISGEEHEIVITFNGLDGFLEQEGSLNDIRLDGQNIELWDLRKNANGQVEAVYTGRITESVLENPGFTDINIIMEREALRGSLTDGDNISFDLTINSSDIGTPEYSIGDVPELDTSSVTLSNNNVDFNRFTILDENQSDGYTDTDSILTYDISALLEKLDAEITNFLREDTDGGNNVDDYFAEQRPTLDVNLVGADPGATVFFGDTKISSTDTGQVVRTSSGPDTPITLGTDDLQRLYELWHQEQESIAAGNPPIQRINLDLQDFIDEVTANLDDDGRVKNNAEVNVQLAGDISNLDIIAIGNSPVESTLKIHTREGLAINGAASLETYDVIKTTDSQGAITYSYEARYFGGTQPITDANGNFITRTVEYIQNTDDNGSPVFTSDGEPVFTKRTENVTDQNGNLVADGTFTTEPVTSGGVPGLFTEWELPNTLLQEYTQNSDPNQNLITIVPQSPEVIAEDIPIFITGSSGSDIDDTTVIPIYPNNHDPISDPKNFLDNPPSLNDEPPSAVNVSDLAISSNILRIEPAEDSDTSFVFSVDLNDRDGEIPFVGDEEQFVYINPAVNGANSSNSGIQVTLPEGDQPFGALDEAEAALELNVRLDFSGDNLAAGGDSVSHAIAIELPDGIDFDFNPLTDIFVRNPDGSLSPSASIWSYDANNNQLILENPLGTNSSLAGQVFEETIVLRYDKATIADQLGRDNPDGINDSNYVTSNNVLQPNFNLKVTNTENAGVVGEQASSTQNFSTFTRGSNPTFIQQGQFANDSFAIYSIPQAGSEPAPDELVRVSLDSVYQQMAEILGLRLDGSSVVDADNVADIFQGTQGDIIQVDFTGIPYNQITFDVVNKDYTVGIDSTREFEGEVIGLGEPQEIQANFIRWYENLTLPESEKHTDVQDYFSISGEAYRDQDFEFSVSVNAIGPHEDNDGVVRSGPFNTTVDDLARTQVVVNVSDPIDLGPFEYSISSPTFSVDATDIALANRQFNEPPASFDFTLDDDILLNLLNTNSSQVVIDFPNLDFAGNGYSADLGLAAAITPNSPWSINYAGKLVWTKPSDLPDTLSAEDLDSLKSVLEPSLSTVSVLVPSSVAFDALDGNALEPEISYGFQANGTDISSDTSHWNNNVEPVLNSGQLNWNSPNSISPLEYEFFFDPDPLRDFELPFSSYAAIFDENNQYQSGDLFIQADSSRFTIDVLNLTYNHAGLVNAYEDLVQATQAHDQHLAIQPNKYSFVLYRLEVVRVVREPWTAWNATREDLAADLATATNVFDNFEPNGKDAVAASGNDVIYAGDTNDGETGFVQFNVENNNSDVTALRGGAGDDILYGAGGDDIVFGGTGRDALFGGEGIDYLDGGSGADVIVAGEPNRDVAGGFTGLDHLEAGNFKIDWQAGIQQNYLNGVAVEGQGIDISEQTYNSANYVGRGTLGGDIIVAGEGDDIIYGGSNNTLIDVSGGGNDTIAYTAQNVFTEENGGDGLNAFDVVIGFDETDKIDLTDIFAKLEESLGPLSKEDRLAMVRTEDITVNDISVDQDLRTAQQSDTETQAKAVYIETGSEIFHIAAIVNWDGNDLKNDNIDVGDTFG